MRILKLTVLIKNVNFLWFSKLVYWFSDRIHRKFGGSFVKLFLYKKEVVNRVPAVQSSNNLSDVFAKKGQSEKMKASQWKSENELSEKVLLMASWWSRQKEKAIEFIQAMC